MATNVKRGEALAANAWTKVWDASVDNAGNPVGEIVVGVDGGSANPVEVAVRPLHVLGSGDPQPADSGAPIAAGQSEPFMAVRAGVGLIKEVWARSAGATVDVWPSVG